MAILCERLGANVDMVRKGIGTDFRIGKHFLYPGLGYGGSCFPKDVQALSKSSVDAAYEFKILNAVMAVNRLQKQFFIGKIQQYYSDNLKGKLSSPIRMISVKHLPLRSLIIYWHKVPRSLLLTQRLWGM
jgi:UDPglucose 6-dehydrogenase